MNKVFLFFSVLLSLQIYHLPANAWGIIGHHTSAKIALDILTNQKSPALIEINKLLKSEDFVKSSTWADEVRSSQKENWKQTSTYHYEKMNDTDTYLLHLKNQTPDLVNQGGVVEATIGAENILKNKMATEIDKKNALKFLIHFIADMHQPLHTGRIADRGGNDIPIKWNGFDLNLHQVWDSQIIAMGHKELFKDNLDQQIKSYADFLKAQFKNTEMPDENKLKYDDWIQESLVPRSDAYKYKDEEAQAYTNRFIKITDLRIYLAGVRIAFTLNRIFPGYMGTNKPTAESDELARKLQHDMNLIVGDIDSIINLKPSFVF